MLVENWKGDSIRFIAPPIYADNPILRSKSANFRNLQVRDANGGLLIPGFDSIALGEHFALRFTLAAQEGPVQIDYDVGFDYDTLSNSLVPAPAFHGDNGFLLGNYVFIVPLRSLELSRIWRDRWNIRLGYTLDPSVQMMGDPQQNGAFRNSYELLFSMSAFGGRELWQSSVLGQQCRLMTILSAPPAKFDSILPSINAIATEVIPAFGRAGDTPLTAILGSIRAPGGLEGTWAYSVLSPWEEDSMGVFNMVLAHEMIHAWVGVRVGDYDDPWWKEGTANYLGFAVARQLGLCSDAYIQQVLLWDLSNDLATTTRALSDEYVRVHIFSPDSLTNCGLLAYIKGAQVSMLLDRRIREASNGGSTLLSLVGRFCRIHSGGAFGRSDYTTFLEQTGAPVSDIFLDYVDKPGVIPNSVLLENYQALVQMGAFSANAKPASSNIKRLGKVRRFPFWNQGLQP